MIISHKYKYVFVELPHTASTAIAKQLVEQYGGEPILSKHATYLDFERVASSEERSYFAFSGIRNPMDEVVSIYLKYKTNHNNAYTDPSKLKRNGGYVTRANLKRYEYVTQEDASYSQFLRKYYKVPYDNWSCLAHHRLNYVIYFERLQRDFERVLDLVGIKNIKPLVHVNKTGGKSDYLSFYNKEDQRYACYVFGPFLRQWGYGIPESWENREIPVASELLYRALKYPRRLYWSQLRGSNALWARSFRAALGR